MSLPPPTKILPGIKKIIGVISGKGGVGKTFVACNLVLSFAKLGIRTGLLDADIYCPDVFRMLGVTAKLTVTSDNKIFPIEKWGIKIMSMAGLCATDDEPVAWRGPIISKIAAQLLKESMWGELDVLVVDFPSGTGDIALTLMQSFRMDGIIIVTTPQMIATADAKRAANMAVQLGIPLIGVMENMRGEIFGEGGGSRTAEALHAQFLGSIPARKQISAMCDQGNPPIFHVEELEMLFSKISRIILQQLMVK